MTDQAGVDPEEPFNLSNRTFNRGITNIRKMPCIPVEYWTPLSDGATDFGVLSGRNQPPGIPTSEHKQEHTTTWVLRSGIAEELPAHVSDGNVLSQEAHIDLLESYRAVLEDSVIRLVPCTESWRIGRNYPVGVGMLRLYGLPAYPQGACHVDEVGVGRKELTESIQIVVVPSRRESRDRAMHVLSVIRRRRKSAGDQ